MNNKIFFMIFIIVIISGGILCFIYKNKFSNNEIYQKINYYQNQNREYRYYISTESIDRKWRKVEKFEGNYLIADATKVRINSINAFIVAYQNGDIIDSKNIFYPLPSGVKFLGNEDVADNVDINIQDLEYGKSKISINHVNVRKENDRTVYATVISNISSKNIKIMKFCSLRKVGDKYKLNTVTKKFFTENDFREWYLVDKDGWIKPGKEVSDPNNYHYGDGAESYWVYFCIDDSGDTFIAGALLPK